MSTKKTTTIRDAIISRMDSYKISRPQLSKLTGISERTIYRNLSGESEMTVTSLINICDALNLSVEVVPEEMKQIVNYTSSC